VSLGAVATKGFDALLVLHSLLAIGAFVVLLVLRSAAAAAARDGELPGSARGSFTGRREVAGRTIHLVPLTGFALLAASRGAYALTTWYVAVGLTAWLVAAWALEARAFPAQLEVATALAQGGTAPHAARRMLLAIEVAAVAIVVAAACMIGGTAG
jgi:hypothetical protein